MHSECNLFGYFRLNANRKIKGPTYKQVSFLYTCLFTRILKIAKHAKLNPQFCSKFLIPACTNGNKQIFSIIVIINAENLAVLPFKKMAVDLVEADFQKF